MEMFVDRIRIWLFAFLLMATIVPRASASEPSRTLEVYNNTDATIVVRVTEREGASVREESIPPQKKASLFNFLDYGQNEVYFLAPYTRPPVEAISQVFYAQSGGRRTQVIELFSERFGRSVMFDSGERSAIQPSSLQMWVFESSEDPCEGYDELPFSERSPDPDPARCNPSTEGTVAVCWDGTNVKNKYRDGAFCTYKKPACETEGKRGMSPGKMYRCQ